MAAQLRTLARNRISLVWLALIVLTLISWRVGTDGGFSAKLAAVIVLIVAFFKVRLVGLYFMELREAPIQLRMILEGYCLVVCATLVIMFLAASGH
jgi:caa(3)-type oxidase subunit IV